MPDTNVGPLMIGGQPIVKGRIVHVVRAGVAASTCRPAMIHGASGLDAVVLQQLGPGSNDSTEAAPHAFDHAVGTWHWPDPNNARCQGRPE